MMSLKAQYNLSNSQKSMSQTLERLSTGLRINSAKDDAAGLAISERFGAQIKGLNQAVRNANDGISFSQTAEGALSTTSANLQRIRELAVQSASGSNTAGDRTALNNEVQALIQEVQRVALNTEFNGQSILNGSQTETFFQVGANQGQMISVNGIDSRTSRLGNQEMVGAAADALNSTEMGYLEDAASIGSATVGGFTISVDMGGTNSTSFTSASATSLEEAVSNINNAIQTQIDGGNTTGQLVGEAGLKAFLRVNNDGNTTIAITGDYTKDTSGAFSASFSASGGVVSATDSLGNTVTADLVDGGASERNIATSASVLTREEATMTIGIMDGALSQINALRADIGAAQARFDSAISNLTVSSNNMSAARSRIRDADFAQETAELTRVQILQQAGISVLSQANQAPQSALSLLQ
nr:flagellin [Rhabdochromatium marinum]